MKCVTKTIIMAGAIAAIQLAASQATADENSSLPHVSPTKESTSLPYTVSEVNASLSGAGNVLPTPAVDRDAGGSSSAAATRSTHEAVSKRAARKCSWATSKGCSESEHYAHSHPGAQLLPAVSVGAEGLKSVADPRSNKGGESDAKLGSGAIHAIHFSTATGTGPKSDFAGLAKVESAVSTRPVATKDVFAAGVAATPTSPPSARRTGVEDTGKIGVNGMTVSEPPTYAMLLAGIAMVGFMVFRRLS